MFPFDIGIMETIVVQFINTYMHFSALLNNIAIYSFVLIANAS